MTAKPVDVTELGEQLYAAVNPLAAEDESEGWPLLRYCDALIGQAQPVRDQSRDRSDHELGWSIMMDVNNCPAYGLEWLSQFAGVDLTKLKKGVNVLLRNEAINPSFEYDANGAEPFGYSKFNGTGTTEELFEVGEGWHSSGKKALKFKGKKDGTGTLRGIGLRQAAGSTNYVPCSAGKWVTIQAKLNILKAAGKGFSINIEWFRADASTLLSTSASSLVFAGATGEHTLVRSLQAPEHAAFARVAIQGFSETASQVIEAWVDEVMALISTAEQPGLIEYCDGDQAGCSWVGTPGRSDSIKSTPQTEEQFNETKRFRIKELPATKRGTPSAIVKAAQQYLIGDKTVILQERPNGNPWRLVVITYTEETLNVALVKEAIEEQMPAGIVLEYSAIPAADWLLIRAEYATWKAVKEAFVTWGGVRLNQPGT